MQTEPGTPRMDLSKEAWEKALAESDVTRREHAEAKTEERREKVRSFKPENYPTLFVKADANWTNSENVGGKFEPIKQAQSSDIGRYGINNGVLAFAVASGDYYIGNPADPEVIRVLEEAGFVGDGVAVPHSNDGGRWFKINVLREP